MVIDFVTSGRLWEGCLIWQRNPFGLVMGLDRNASWSDSRDTPAE